MPKTHTTVYKSTCDFGQKSGWSKRLHGCRHIRTANTDSCIVSFLVCWFKGHVTHYRMCAAFNSLCNVKCCKIFVATSCTKLYIQHVHIQVHKEVPSFGDALYHHIAPLLLIDWSRHTKELQWWDISTMKVFVRYNTFCKVHSLPGEMSFCNWQWPL